MNEKVSTDVQLILENVRVSYLYAFRPYEGKKDDGSVSKTFCVHPLLEPTDPQLQKVREAQRAVAKAAWGEALVDAPIGPADENGNVPMGKVPAWQAVMNELASKDKLCLHNGSVSKPREADVYGGKFFISANNSKQPNIFCEGKDAKGVWGNLNITENPGHPLAPYSGSICDVMVSIYAQGPANKPHKFGRRINAQFMGVKFKKHAQAFGGGKVATGNEFGVSGADADAAMPAQQSFGTGAGSDLI
jgi:hypothetical protein